MDASQPGKAICWVSRVQRDLKGAGLRPTRQRLLLASLLYREGDRHVTAEKLHAEAGRIGVTVSLATVYNTLHQFTQAGMLRVLALDAAKTYFDTNTSDHCHFFVEGEDTIMDIPAGLSVSNIPIPPPGMEIVNVDVVVRLRRSPQISAQATRFRQCLLKQEG